MNLSLLTFSLIPDVLLCKLDAEKLCTVSDIAMRYIFGSEMKVCALVSTSSARRMRQNVQASLAPLTPEESRFLETGER